MIICKHRGRSGTVLFMRLFIENKNNMKVRKFMKKIITLAFIATLGTAVIALESSEANVPKSPLTIYSGGLSIGVLSSLNDSLKKESKTFFKLSFDNDIRLSDNTHLFIDVDWLAPGSNFGALFGIDYLLATSAVRPFVGGGAGVRLIDKDRHSFGDNIGPAASLHAGVNFDLSKTVQMRIRAPFHIVLNSTRDFGAGLDFGILFSRPYRNVQKLNY
jgi:hypothetical protein